MPAPNTNLNGPRRIFFLCYVASGAAGLVYQVVWTRLLTLELGHTVAASSTVLAAFMGGLAAGAWLAGRTSLRDDRRLQAYAALELAIAIFAIALPLFVRGTIPVLGWAYADGTAQTRFTLIRVALSLGLLGIPAAAMGATYPIATSWLAARSGSAVDAGILYAANSAGAAAGAIGAGFWLIPTLGLRGTTWIGVALNVGAAAGAMIVHRRSSIGDRPSSIGDRPSLSGDRQAASVQPWSATAVRRQMPTHRRSTHGDRAANKGVSRATIDNPGSTTDDRRWTTDDRRLAAMGAALSGFMALVHEVAWTRVIALLMGPTTYAFSTMVASFVSGIAIGSFAATRLVRRGVRPGLWLAAMLMMLGVAGAVASWIATSRLPLLLARDIGGGAAFDSIIFRELLYIVVLLIPTSVAAGAAFPFALASSGLEPGTAGTDSARIYAANTVGAVSGALSAGFLLIPNLGLQSTFTWMARAGILGAALIALGVMTRGSGRASATKTRHSSRAPRRHLAVAVAMAMITFGLIEMLPSWDRDLLTSGPYKYGRYIAADGLAESLRAGTLEYYKEGAASTVSVRRLGGSLALAIDGKVDASNAGDMLTQRMLGLLPVLLHPKPQDLLVIGLGSGVTASSALASGEVVRADVIEISPEVIEASAWFARENRDVLKAPPVRVLTGDGRSHLLLSQRRYDVIVSEPSNPWMAGVAALFTREFFQAARDRLKPGGVLCQWAHTYEIGEDDLKSIAATFAAVFPQGTMWMIGDGDLLLIGAAESDIEARVQDLPRRLTRASIGATLQDVGITGESAPFVVMSLFAGGPAALAAYGKGATIQSDDRMALEFTAAQAMYSRAPNNNAEHIRALLSDIAAPPSVAQALRGADDRSWAARGHVALKAGAFAMARDSFRRAATINTRSADALRGLSQASGDERLLTDLATWLQSLAAAEPANAVVRVELSHVLASLGRVDEAIAAATEAGRLDPQSPLPAEQLASIFADIQDPARLTPLADALRSRFPQRADSHYYYAASLFLSGRASDAVLEARSALAINPEHAGAQNLLGAACATAGNLDCARAALERAVELSPRDAAPYINLGFFHLQTGDPRAAVGSFGEALALQPESDAARKGIAQAREATRALRMGPASDRPM